MPSVVHGRPGKVPATRIRRPHASPPGSGFQASPPSSTVVAPVSALVVSAVSDVASAIAASSLTAAGELPHPHIATAMTGPDSALLNVDDVRMRDSVQSIRWELYQGARHW